MSVRRPRMWLIAGCIVGGVIVLGIALSIFLPGHRPTRALPDKTLMETLADLHEDQCEWPNGPGVFVEPQNTWSNLGYLLAGVLILLRARSLPGIFFGAHLGVLAFFSANYHATVHLHRPNEIPVSQIMDVVFVYAALLSAIVYGVYSVSKLCRFRVRPWVWWFAPALLAGFDGLSLATKVVLGFDSTVVFIALIGILLAILAACALIAVALGNWTEGDPGAVVKKQFGGLTSFWWQLFFTLGVSCVGCIYRLKDGYDTNPVVEKLLCFPKGALQAHALWHGLGALGLLMAYDLFAQFQKAGDDSTTDRPVMIDQLALLWSSRAWIFTAAVLAGTLALLLGLVRASPSPILVFLGGFLLVTGLLFLVISFVRRGDPMDWS